MGNGKHPSYAPTRQNVLTCAHCLPAITAGRTTLDARVNARIVIIGAGLAGLPAARDRIGERICTPRAWPDMPTDLGASRIHGAKGNPLTAPAADFL